MVYFGLWCLRVGVSTQFSGWLTRTIRPCDKRPHLCLWRGWCELQKMLILSRKAIVLLCRSPERWEGPRAVNSDGLCTSHVLLARLFSLLAIIEFSSSTSIVYFPLLQSQRNPLRNPRSWRWSRSLKPFVKSLQYLLPFLISFKVVSGLKTPWIGLKYIWTRNAGMCVHESLRFN